MFGHRSDKDGEVPHQTEARGPVMGASASSNRTAVFDESPALLGFLSRRFRRSSRGKKSTPEVSNSAEHDIAVLASQAGGSRGIVTYDHSNGSSDNDDNSSSSAANAVGQKERKTTKSNAVNTNQLSGRSDKFFSAPSQVVQHTQFKKVKESICAPVQGNAVGSGNVHVTPSSSQSGSANSSDTEYAPPSVGGDEANDASYSNQSPQVPLPPSGPPAHALMAEACHNGDKALSSNRQSDLFEQNKRGEDRKKLEHTALSAAFSSTSKSSSPGSHASSVTTTTTTATETTSYSNSSDSGDSDSDEEDRDDTDSVRRTYSERTNQSVSPSSHAPFSNSSVRHHPLLSPSSPTYWFPTRDVRSSRVSTNDVDVAVLQEQRRQRQQQLYLHAALYLSISSTGGSSVCSNNKDLPPLSAPALTQAQSGFLHQRADAVYQRHMNAFVESYLSAPRYRTALTQFRKHMSVPEQQMRTTDAQEQYLRATEVVVSRAPNGPCSAGGGNNGPSTLGEAFYSVFGAPGQEDDWQRIGSDAANTATGADRGSCGGFLNYVDVGSGHPTKGGADLYRLEKADLELLAGDKARRARLLDDTLPWRPIDFDATGVRLEALEHPHAELGATDAMTGTGAVAPAVGGSVNLLIEVLIMTEVDVPFTSTIPTVNYTNIFLLLASLFVQPEVLLTKFIRFYRSVRAWEAEVEDISRATYLEQRVLQCISVYCRVHETDLTLSCLQRLAVFAASEGFLSPVNLLNDAVGKDLWPCQEGVYCSSRRRAAVHAQTAAVAAATAAGHGGNAQTSTNTHGNNLASLRRYKRHVFMEPGRAADSGTAGTFPQRNSLIDPSALLNPATRAPLQNEVAQMLLEFVMYLQRTIMVYYRPVELPSEWRQSLPFVVEGPLRVFVDTAAQRPSLGCTSSLRTYMTTDPRAPPESLLPGVGFGGGGCSSSNGARVNERVPGSTGLPSNGNGTSYDQWYNGVNPPIHLYDGGERDVVSQGSSKPSGRGLGLGGREGTTTAAAGWANGAQKSVSPKTSTLETTVAQKPLSVVDIDAEHLSRQICLLSFSLFIAVHIRELLNNAWTDPFMKVSVSKKLMELMEFSAHLRRWTAAIIITPSTWADCQRGLRYFLEVCRTLYEQQNYEMAAAILEGLRHPAVEYLERAYSETRRQGLLSSVERRELETLQELMDPFASYSPSSLYSVTARTVGDMETPMIPLLSPILGVIFRSEDVKGSTVSIRSSDGKAIVNWSKVLGLGKMVVLWMRCQYTPFTFAVDPEIQEFLWSTMNHQWTDSLLMRTARRAKQ